MPWKSKSPAVVETNRLLEPLERRTLMAVGAPVSVGVNLAQKFQTIQGMGAGMIPWALPKEYTQPAFFDAIVNDLGATMARASILPLAEKTNDDNDPNHFNWAGFDAASLAPSFEFFKQMQARGVNKFIGSAWTAPAWMKTNNLYSDGGALRPDRYAEFAEYLSAVTQIAKNNYGIDLTAISPQNEPYFVEPYESTTYTAPQFRDMLKAVVTKFKADGVKTQLMLPEDLIFEDRNSWYASKIMNDPVAKQFVGVFAGHGLATHWDQIRDALAPYGREFWMTETSGTSGKTWEGAIGMANSIMNAIGTANASAYVYWQFSDGTADTSKALMFNGVPTTKYYAAKQFYRWIRPGMVHVGTPSSTADLVRVESFRDPATGAITTVILNKDPDSHDVTFNLTNGSGLPGTYRVFRSSSTENCISLGSITGGSNFTLNIAGSSITTITSMPDPMPHTAATAVPANIKIQGTVNFTSGKQFFIASYKGYIESLTAQINGGADVNQTLQGWTPLQMAAGGAHAGSILTLNYLLDHGANVNATNNEGWTALHAAAANTFIKFRAAITMQSDKVNTLIAHGANPNARDANGRTPLMWAAMLGAYLGFSQDPSIVKALLAGGADPFAKDNAGMTALDYTNAPGYDRLADVLIAAMGTDKTKPTGDIVDVSPDPRDTAVTDFFINFSERVQGFDLADIVLTVNGTVLPIPIDGGVILSSEDDIHYQLSGMGGLTSVPGNFVLTVKASGTGITDPSLNPLAADFSDAWTKGNVPPPPPTGQTPFKGLPFAVNSSSSTTIELEDYDNGGEGVAYHDIDAKNNGGAYRTTTGVDVQPSTDIGGGFNVGYTRASEWLEYSINVADAGAYSFDFRLASTAAGGKFHAEVDGADVTGALAVPNTGGWQTWQTLSKSGVNLTAGQHVLRVALDAVGSNNSVGNFNWLRITPGVVNPNPPTTIVNSTSSYARGGGSANLNFGADPTLVIKKHSDPSFAREAFLTFDLSSLTTFNSAKLRLFGALNDTSSPSVQSQVFGGFSTLWDEATVTWNTRPTAIGSALATVTVAGTAGQWYEFDVTAYLQAEKALGHNTVTLVLKNPTQQNALVVFNSDDAAANRPELAVL